MHFLKSGGKNPGNVYKYYAVCFSSLPFLKCQRWLFLEIVVLRGKVAPVTPITLDARIGFSYLLTLVSKTYATVLPFITGWCWWGKTIIQIFADVNVNVTSQAHTVYLKRKYLCHIRSPIRRSLCVSTHLYFIPEFLFCTPERPVSFFQT